MRKRTRILFLIGPRASGKSTIARILAARLDLPVYDTDDMVMDEAGCSIAEIVRHEGWESFRARESRALALAVALAGGESSFGGDGAPLAGECPGDGSGEQSALPRPDDGSGEQSALPRDSEQSVLPRPGDGSGEQSALPRPDDGSGEQSALPRDSEQSVLPRPGDGSGEQSALPRPDDGSGEQSALPRNSEQSVLPRPGDGSGQPVSGSAGNAAIFAPGAVLSTGGGMVLARENRERMRAAGTVFYLAAPPACLVDRLKNQGDSGRRPSLTGEDPLAELTCVLLEREPLYRETAHHVIDATIPRAAMAQTIIDLLTPAGEHFL